MSGGTRALRRGRGLVHGVSNHRRRGRDDALRARSPALSGGRVKQENWVKRAETALAAGTVSSEMDKLLAGHRPVVLDGEGVKAILSPFLASLVWSAAIFREMVSGTSLDPLGMALRLLALGLTFRVVLLGAPLLRRLSVFLNATGHGLVLTPEGLFYRSPSRDIVIEKEDVVGVVEHGTWQDLPRGRRWSEVYVVTDPATTGRTHIALPPVFEETPGRLAERLARWLGAPRRQREITAKPAEAASKLYDEAAAGILPDGVAVIHHGFDWIKTGPYALLLVGVIAIDSLIRGGPSVWDAVEPWMAAGLLLGLLAIPGRWLWTTRREVSPRKGVAMVITPAEVLMRIPEGMLRARWSELAAIGADAKKKWSVLEGAHSLRHLVLTRNHAPPIRYEEPFLGVPVEVARVLLDAYRTGRLPGSHGDHGTHRDDAGVTTDEAE